MLKHRPKLTQKHYLSQTMRSWLPILQASGDELLDEIKKMADNNPCVEIKSKNEEENPQKKSKAFTQLYKKGRGVIEELNIAKNSIYDDLEFQISKSLFPSQKSQIIARKIIQNLDDCGYFDADASELANEINAENLQDFPLVDAEQIEQIRARFCYLEPCGVGAKDYKEALYFQLLNSDVDDKIFKFIKNLINNFENISKFIKNPLYKDAIKILKTFSTPPFLSNFADSQEVIADIIVYRDDTGLHIKINDEFYPEISIIAQDNDEFFKQDLKAAKSMIDSLQMRKATLKKLGLMIIEYQFEYFLGGQIRPMRLSDIAKEIDRSPSTISRAIANKYICSPRGTIAIKEFFATQIEGQTSNKSIKDFVAACVKNENHKKPLSDQAILEQVIKEFKVQMVRRTITKYRKMLDIASSNERKKIYALREGK